MKAVSADYQPRSMAHLCQDALEVLREADGQPLRCGYIGGQLFDDATHRGSAPFARIAGKVIRRLEATGLVEYKHDPTGFGGWIVTPAGRRCDYR